MEIQTEILQQTTNKDFSPIGLDQPYWIIVQNNPVNRIDPEGLLTIPFTNIWINAGEKHGESAAMYWAEKSISHNNKWYETGFYNTMGLFASLWTPCTSDATFNTLLSAYGVRNAGRVWHLRDGTPARTVIDYGKLFRLEKHMIGKVKKGTRAMKWHIDAIWGKIRHWPHKI